MEGFASNLNYHYYLYDLAATPPLGLTDTVLLSSNVGPHVFPSILTF